MNANKRADHEQWPVFKIYWHQTAELLNFKAAWITLHAELVSCACYSWAFMLSCGNIYYVFVYFCPICIASQDAYLTEHPIGVEYTNRPSANLVSLDQGP